VLCEISGIITVALLDAFTEGVGSRLAEWATRVLVDVILVAMMALWTKLGVLICLSSSRKNENEADAYALQLGYGEDLCRFLEGLGPSHAKGLWAALNSSHPKNEARIAYLQQLGCDYQVGLPSGF